MKLFMFLLLALGAYFLWAHLSSPEVAPEVKSTPVPTPVPSPAPTPVDFPIKMRVKRILEEWKMQSLAEEVGERRVSIIHINAEINDIRRRLYALGLHDARSLRETMVQAAKELGYAPDQADYLVGRALAERSRRP